MLVRRSTDSDLDDVLRLRLTFIAELREVEPEELDPAFVAATQEYLDDVTARDRIRSWLAEVDGEVAGLVSVLTTDAPPLPEELRAHEGYIVNMFVEPSARSRGVGRALLAAAIDAAHDEGWRRVFLHATEAGRPLYEQTGFTGDARWMALRLP